MELVDINIFNLDYYRDYGIPHNQFKLLRKIDPVHWQEEEQDPDRPEISPTGYWAITRHEDIKQISRDPATFSSNVAGTNIKNYTLKEQAVLKRMIINLDPPEHVQLRRLVKGGFTPRMIQKLEPRIKRVCRDVFDSVIEKGNCEFVKEVTSEIPLIILCDLMGVPQADRRKIYDWSNQLIGFDDPENPTHPDEALAVSMELWRYANNLGNERRKCPMDDITSILVHAEIEGNRLSQLDYDIFFLLLSVAGNETTRTAMTQGTIALLEHPAQWDLLKSNPELYIDSAVEEILRWVTPIIHFRRTATKDIELRGKTIKEGDKVVLYYPSANRDEDVFTDPDVFDITRKHNPHLTFGDGEHFCLGSVLARYELKHFFWELATRMPDISLAGPYLRLRSNFVNGIKSMPVNFTPGVKIGWDSADDDSGSWTLQK
ncbi:steroid C26-monooxygenase-like [Ylistrum balloti]|uniref:steroid C26-monooxygenase-like n=1 Tax=Ylistrum balloti TaxID=509963 RepID=UPI0029059F65|nr:steroid C26-monooxygenase-like [Ylistrum balloti]